MRVATKIFVLLSLLLSALLQPGRALAHSPTSLRVDTMSNGIKLSLIVPRRVYPRAALVQVTVRLEVVSARPVVLPYTCPQSNPLVEVLKPSGRVVYPVPEPVSFPSPSCPARTITDRPASYAPHSVHVWHLYAVLWGSGIRATESIGQFGTMVTTPISKVRLVPSTRPTLSLSGLPTVIAIFQGSGIHRHRLRYAISFSCVEGRGLFYEAGRNSWAKAPGPRFHPADFRQCSKLREVHLLAAYPDHPVAVYDYVAKSE